MKVRATLILISALPFVGPEEPPRRFVGITTPSEKLEIGSAQAGVIEVMSVREGQMVKAGQPLFRLETAVEALEVARLQATAESDAKVRSAKARLRQAQSEERRLTDLFARQIANEADLDQRRREAELARIEVEQAEVDRNIARWSHEIAKARLAQRVVKSPIDGYVARRLRSRGEPVEELQAVLELVRLDPMYVEFDCPVGDAGLVREGVSVQVHPAQGEAVRAKVILASRTVDAASQTLRVRLELAKPLPRAGVKVFVEVGAE